MSMNQNEFEIRAKRMRPRLVETALRCLDDADEADDIAQETLLRLWCMRDKLDEYRSVEALAIVICRHLSLDRLKRMRMLPIENDVLTQLSVSPEDDSERVEDIERLRNLIDKLPDGQQIILRMKHIEEMEISEIAEIIGSTQGAVRVQLSRARNRIKELFLNKR